MMNYKLSLEEKDQHFLAVEFRCKTYSKKEIELQLPAWRPGRYQLANFAKNIQKFEVFNEDNNSLPFSKITKDRWKVEVGESEEILVKYNYYAVDFNAGSTYVGDDVLYVNPVNCFLYVDDLIDKPCKLTLPISRTQKVAGLNGVSENVFKTINFHDLVDSPFIISSKLQEKKYTVQNTVFHVWFYGECKPEWEMVLTDFKKFTTYQLSMFGDIPTAEYHFVNIIHPYKTYHGVEHVNSTIITLGPSYDVFKNLYTEFLGVSSHELYHVWNIKTIRPKEMMPYQYAKENYSKLGYVAEGVTTYMGDLMLFESGVFDKKQYIKEFNQYLKRHFFNDGRSNLSVADSSFDTWLDGYELGVPSRKSSIYMEGALVAFMTDAHIRKQSNGNYSLHDVMKDLHLNFGKKGIGYTEQDYINTVEKYLGKSWVNFYEKYVVGTHSFEEELKDCLTYMGYSLKKEKSNKMTNQIGLVCQDTKDGTKVVHSKVNSVAYKVGLSRGDIIKSINGIKLDKNLDEWLLYFKQDDITLQVERDSFERQVSFSKIEESKHQFFDYSIE